MNVLLVSECTKNALKETRRILDQFAERRGERTWQTAITQDGLDTLRRLLRKTARKNTAVACHWIRGRDHSELLWIVGDASRFNAQGAVPTNTTCIDRLRRADENDWHSGQDIRLLAQLAALLHDLGKASIAFQERLRGGRSERNLYRHEWVSLRLFQAFVGKDDDEVWLQRLANADSYGEDAWLAPDRYQRDGLDAREGYPFRSLPPLAAAVGWLVVTHHRLPVAPCERDDGAQAAWGRRVRHFNPAWLTEPLALVAHDWNEVRQGVEARQIEPYWMPAGPLPVLEPKWRAQASRLAKRLLELRKHRNTAWLENPYVMHLARLALMLADHHYSSLPLDSSERVEGGGRTALYANTDRGGRLKQPLDEHLLGVARDAGLVAHALPGFERHLPRLARHRGLRKRSADPRFAWQDRAADAAAALRESAYEHGAFIINMASTGCGKTLANARIAYALADPQHGMRLTYALGLRTLTLQTGRSYRNDLNLDDNDLAIRVGGSASRALFEYYERQAEAQGSASVQRLIEEDSHVLYDGASAEHPLLSRALRDADIRSLLSAPVLVCTVDHMTPATEALRAGRQIAPMLRLMSADLVLDELDDYDLDDMPALTRLVYWAGMLGTRVVLSSATLAPALVEGMYLAYRAGRLQYGRNRGSSGGQAGDHLEVPCLWVDEFGVQCSPCPDARTFASEHAQFIAKRASKLEKAAPLRRGDIWPIEPSKGQPKERLRGEFAQHVLRACLRLHDDHAEADPATGKRVSFGLVRMANIDPLFDVARAMFALGAPEGYRIHLCVYHARFPALQRSAIEHQLDGAFDRRGDGRGPYRQPFIRAALNTHPEENQVFVVLASPVCEVGRDWDADWAVVEPSSMRSLIQLAGRVQRHRRQGGEKPNVLLLDRNIKALEGKLQADGAPAPVFIHPGYERNDARDPRRFRLRYHRLSRLLSPEEYRALTALPRIRPRPEAEWACGERLVDLEHARMAASLLPRERLPVSVAPSTSVYMERDEAAWSWLYPQATLTGVLPQQQPFREDPQPKVTLVFLPDEEEERLVLHRVEDGRLAPQRLYVRIDAGLRHDVRPTLGERISAWTLPDLMELLVELADAEDITVLDAARRFASVEVPQSTQGWLWHPWLGFAPA
ncbi:type I-F CRISPR-associated helicase Cas3f [Vulcaniibacterium thermophilum]|uniref:Type I-F CRISPR-associated helicase Cas3 n=1 Tax=Vulcaniibacterium thermophilum TaxID=1169913 RepID=A0A918Z9V0_9GAMM|nr:type I-F CRISPR-associated helicase Cas3f [Vulcaniibacterium thermophilum]GHE40005.1 type I-F CRISPR-associated helicase Cas3 [Vulcaniibacterium thermophilum]